MTFFEKSEMRPKSEKTKVLKSKNE